MSSPHVEIIPLPDTGDHRGRSFSIQQEWLQSLGPIQDCHLMTIEPGHIRGNHYHKIRREVIVVMYRDKWTMCWDTGPSTEVHRRTFTGVGTVIVTTEPQCSHAVVNEGKADLLLVGLSDQPYNASSPDSFPRVVTQ